LRERALILAALLGLSALSWAYLALWQSAAEGAGMAGMGAPGAAPSRLALGVDFLMWCIMMAGMMLPSAAPMILTFATISRRRRARGELFVPTSLFAAGYLLVWAGFSLLAAAVNWAFGQGPAASPLLGGLVFLAAGAYQLTPLKNVCLAKCRSPFEFLLFRWRERRMGALAMGLDHGFYCLLCCWLLMALLFVGGAMNLLWAAAIAAFVFVEKGLPQGAWTARASGGLMIASGLYLLIS
jgi:predicted metal-binding membrane protein